MNLPSLDKFAPVIKPGGVLVVNSSLIHKRSGRDDIDEFRVPADDIALEEGSRRSANLVVLGALVGLREIVGRGTIENAIREAFAKKPQFVQMNLNSFGRGYDLARAGESDD
jgi:2-oxoglutarate ferredoxin oxidoreductase subunit gamma